MAKWKFDRAGTWEYPALGIRATTGDVYDAPSAPDAFWSAASAGAAETVTYIGGTSMVPVYTEPRDGTPIVYDADTNSFTASDATISELVVDALGEFGQGLGAWTVSKAGTASIGFTAAGGGLAANVPTDSTDRAALVRTITPAAQVTMAGWWRATTAGLVTGSNVPAFRFYAGAQRLADIYRANNDGTIWLRTTKAAGGSSYTFTTTGVKRAVGEWAYLSLTYSPVTGAALVKVDGATVINTTIADRFAATAIDNLSLGSTEPGNSGAWEAREIRVTTA